MTKRILFFTLLLLFGAQGAKAQQEPLFAQYMSNAFLINPAVAGSEGQHAINLFHRWQWVSFPGAPKTFGVSYQGMIKDLHGVGGLLFADVTGPTSRQGVKGSYAFHIPLSDRTMRLSLGVAGRAVRNVIRTNAITFIDMNDQAVVNANDAVTTADAEFGIFFYAPKFYVGASAPNLIQSKFNFGTETGLRDPIAYGYRHYFLTGGYRFDIPEKGIVIEPSIMFKYVNGPGPQIDGGLTMRFLENQLAFGVFYRSPHFLSLQCRFVFDNKLPLLLSFDVALSKFQQYSVGATEVMMGYQWGQIGIFDDAPMKKDKKKEEEDKDLD